MRKLKYGMFYDKYIPSGDDYFWDTAPIGAHAALNRQKAENKKTEGYEFYYVDEANKIHIVRNATALEKTFALICNKQSPKKFIGFRNTAIIEDENEEPELEE